MDSGIFIYSVSFIILHFYHNYILFHLSFCCKLFYCAVFIKWVSGLIQ